MSTSIDTNIVEKIEKVYSLKKIKSITKKEDDFFCKFESDDDLKSLTVEQLKAYLKYYESRKENYQSKYFPLITSANLVMAGFIGGAVDDFAKNNSCFLIPFAILALLVSLGMFYCTNIVSRKENKICLYLSYIIARKS